MINVFYLQGHDTTAMASNWAVHLIGNNPEVQRKVHEELDKIFGKTVRIQFCFTVSVY